MGPDINRIHLLQNKIKNDGILDETFSLSTLGSEVIAYVSDNQAEPIMDLSLWV